MATRQRLVGAAIAAFSDKGYHGTTTRDIAMKAGMSPAAVYTHYASKEELLFVISVDGHQRTLEMTRRSLSEHEQPAQSLASFVRNFVQWHAHRHTTARISQYELAALCPEHLEQIAELRRRTQAAVCECLDRGVTDGVFVVADTRITAVALLSLGIDVARWYRDEADWTPEHIAEYYVDMALRMVGAGDHKP